MTKKERSELKQIHFAIKVALNKSTMNNEEKEILSRAYSKLGDLINLNKEVNA